MAHDVFECNKDSGTMISVYARCLQFYVNYFVGFSE